MTNIQDIFTLLLETEDKYPPKCKIRCRNAQTWSSWMNTTLSLKEKNGAKTYFKQWPVLFCLYSSENYKCCFRYSYVFSACYMLEFFAWISVYHMYTWYQEQVLNLLKHKLQMTVSSQVGAGNQISVLCKNITYF